MQGSCAPEFTGTHARRERVIVTFIAWGPAAAWAVVLFLLSEGQGVAGLDFVFQTDKLVHLGLYAVFGGTLAWGRRRSGAAFPHWLVVAAGIAYGATDEIHQLLVPGRSASFLDFLVDGAGVILGYFVVRRRWPRPVPHSTERSLSS